ncbi:MAG TPA: GFA family protein [Polyangiaceae bacterium]|nr:GFA family protein [Polyangiaceae bacterium]
MPLVAWPASTIVECACKDAALELTGAPRAQFYCHCEDCQVVHGAACVPVALYLASSVKVVRGVLGSWQLKTTPRRTCVTCGLRLFAEPNDLVRGVTATLLPSGRFQPAFHINCDSARLPVRDALPHYRRLPARMGGSDQIVEW